MNIDPDTGGVTVVLALDQAVKLYEDYRIEIVTSSALGGKQLNIQQGSNDRPEVSTSSQLDGLPPKDLIEEAVGAIDFIRRELEEGGAIRNFSLTASNLVQITEKINHGEGTVAKLLNDSDLYDEAREVAANLNTHSENLLGVSENIKNGKGTLGKLLSEDETLYEDVKTVAANLRDSSEKISSMVARVDEGKGSLGKLLSEDDALYQNLRETSDSMKVFTAKLNSGEGTLSKLMSDEELYIEILELVREARAALDDLRETSPITTFGTLFFGAF